MTFQFLSFCIGERSLFLTGKWSVKLAYWNGDSGFFWVQLTRLLPKTEKCLQIVWSTCDSELLSAVLISSRLSFLRLFQNRLQLQCTYEMKQISWQVLNLIKLKAHESSSRWSILRSKGLMWSSSCLALLREFSLRFQNSETVLDSLCYLSYWK